MKVKLENITKRFDKVVAVNKMSIEFNDGELICLLGPSGCGKSTLLNMLSGILPVSDGKIYFDNDDVTDLAPQHRGVGLVFQNYALYPHMSVLENICFPLEIKKVPKKEREAEAIKMAKLVKIDEYLDRYPSQLSGGQQQRVAIARALIKKPRLLLLDEPLSNLDARLRLEMREEIRRIQKETKVTTIFVTHDQEEAMSISDRIVLMKKGFLIQEAKPQELYNDPNHLFVSTFLGNPPINIIEGELSNDLFTFADGSFSFKLNKQYADGKYYLGIRPEAIIIDDENYHFKAELIENYEMGKEELALIKLGSKTLRCFISANDISDNKILSIRLKDKGVFLFELESEARNYGKK